jgi:hypothetical protein
MSHLHPGQVPGSVASGRALPPEAISSFLQDFLSMTSARQQIQYGTQGD